MAPTYKVIPILPPILVGQECSLRVDDIVQHMAKLMPGRSPSRPDMLRTWIWEGIVKTEADLVGMEDKVLLCIATARNSCAPDGDGGVRTKTKGPNPSPLTPHRADKVGCLAPPPSHAVISARICLDDNCVTGVSTARPVIRVDLEHFQSRMM